jgi:hypothetical protein
MPRRKKSKTASDQPSKADQIRNAANVLPKPVRPRDVIAKLKEEGVVVTSPHVVKVLKSAGFRRKRRRRKVSSGAAALSAIRNHVLNLESLLAAKALVVKVGSVEAAEEALKTLKKLQ